MLAFVLARDAGTDAFDAGAVLAPPELPAFEKRFAEGLVESLGAWA